MSLHSAPGDAIRRPALCDMTCSVRGMSCIMTRFFMSRRGGGGGGGGGAATR